MTTSLAENRPTLCSSCERDKINVEATSWCQNCFEGLCQNCSCYHAKSKLSVHHKVLPLADVDDELRLLRKVNINTQCDIHPEYPLIILCPSHNVFCCMLCILADHSTCKNVQFIDQAEADYSLEIRKTDIQEIIELRNHLYRVIEEESLVMKDETKKYANFVNRVRNTVEDVKKKLDMIYQEIQDPQNEETIMQVYKKRINIYQNIGESLTDYLNLLQAHSKISSFQSFVARHKMFSLMQANADERLNILANGIPALKFSFGEHAEIKNLNFTYVTAERESHGLIAFSSECRNTFDKLFLHLSNHCSAQLAIDTASLTLSDLSLDSIAIRSDIYVGDGTFDGVYAPDDSVLVSDHDNYQLIRLDENLRFLEKLPVAGKPSGLCISTDSTFVHVVCDHDKVVSYKLQGHWKEFKRFSTECDAWGIACHGDTIVTGHERCVAVHNSGKLVSKIKTSQRSFFPALSHDGKMLHHKDGFDDVVCRSMGDAYQELWRYSSKQLSSPCGIDTDKDGNILILGSGSRNIHIVPKNGKNGKLLIKKMQSFGNQRGLFCNKDKNTVCVTVIYDKISVEMYRVKN